MNVDSAWEEFVSSGSVLDYLTYRSQVKMEDALLPHESENMTAYNTRGIYNEGRIKWNNSPGNRSK